MQKIGKTFLVLLCVSIISSCIGGKNNTIQETENTAIPTQNTEEVTKTITENTEEATKTVAQQIKKPKVFHFGADISHFSEEDQEIIVQNFELNKKAEVKTDEMALMYKEGKKQHYFIERAHPYIDLNTIEFLSTSIFKDSKNIYALEEREIKIIKDADISTFQKVDKFYFRDKNFIYNGFGQKLDHIDIETFQNIGFAFAKDKNGVYQYGEKLNIIPKNFIALSKYYFINDDKVFLSVEGRVNRITELPNVDAKTFKILGNNFTKDKNRVYYYDKPFDGDPETFEVIDGYFSKDKNYVYKMGEKTDFDAKTFVKLGYEFLRDKNNFILRSTPMHINADIKTLEVINQSYTKDKNAVYDGRAQDKYDFDPKTFEVLNDYYVKDKNGIYIMETRIPEANPKTFVALLKYFGKDDKNIFYYGDIFKVTNSKNNVDYSTFEVIYDSYTKDKNGVYYGSSLIEGADPQSFVFISYGYTKDKNNVYHHGLIIPGADPQSFVVLTNYHSKDKNFFYYEDKKVRENK